MTITSSHRTVAFVLGSAQGDQKGAIPLKTSETPVKTTIPGTGAVLPTFL